MSKRLDQKRQSDLEPHRIAYAKKQIEALGFEITLETSKELQFKLGENIIHIWPYSGYFNGKGIVAGRGIELLLDQLKKIKWSKNSSTNNQQ